MDFIRAHRKAILAAIGAVLVIFVDDATAAHIIAGVDAVLILIVPNDQAAIERIYRKG